MHDAPQSPRTDIEQEQSFVTRAYERLDALRDQYTEQQKNTHARHGVGNAQGWTERDALAAHFGEMAARLQQVEERLVFGRLDTQDAQTHYVGRTSLSDEAGQPLVVDWRAPVSRPFYQATPRDPQGMVRRRHIATRARTVLSVEDELLDAEQAHEQGLSLQGEGALMSALEHARDGRMGDIVATIQAEQDRVIRASDDGLLVVQGGPGTGKTAVALHRAAYLLYAQRERLERSGVLLVGPSRTFLRYIEQVLPSLGESGVVNTTLGDLLPGIHTTQHDTETVAEIKGRSLWSRLLREAVRQIVRIPSGDQKLQVWNRQVVLRRDEVIDAVDRMRRSGRPHNMARDSFAMHLMEILAKRLVVEAGDARSDGSVDPDDMSMWIAEIRDSVDCRRAINLAWMPTSAPTFLGKLLSDPERLAAANRAVGSPLSPKDCSLLMRSRHACLTVEDIPIVDELEELLGMSAALAQRDALARARSEEGELERAREALQAQNLGGGIVTAEMLAEYTRAEREVAPLAERARADRSWTYGHIVVDEAQDLSPMAWRALLRRCPARSMTVVGDLDQRRGHNRPTSWAQALGPAARALSSEHVLSVSYRTPRTLTTLAESVMALAGSPVVHPMQAVRDVENCYRVRFLSDVPKQEGALSPAGAFTEAEENADDASIPPVFSRDTDAHWRLTREVVLDAQEHLDEVSGQGSGRIAIIVSEARGRVWNADDDGVSSLDQRVSVLTAAGSKGLEFDSVIVVEPSEILADGPGDLFVALTRATRDLTVVTRGDLPRGMEEWA